MNSWDAAGSAAALVTVVSPMRSSAATPVPRRTTAVRPGGQATFALGHPEKIVDFGYRALKETTDNSKAIIKVFTGKGPRRSYFNGCSDGGREALMEAQRFPDDFDGIIVGSPANFWTHLLAGTVWNEQALLDDPASYIPPSVLPVLSKAALAQCARPGWRCEDGFVLERSAGLSL